MCVSTVIKPREIAVMSCVSTIDLIAVTLRSYIKPRELAVMSRVLGLSSTDES
jgi:hypothetical protein